MEGFVTCSTVNDELLAHASKNMDKMLRECPKELGSFTMYGGHVQSPRHHKSYMRTPIYDKTRFRHSSYMFGSAEAKHEEELPDVFQPYLEFVNSLGHGMFNQASVNWYLTGDEHTPR